MKIFRYAVDGVINFSQVPLGVASWFGLFMTAVSFATVIVIALRRLVWGDPVAGWASIVCVMTLIGGVQLFCMGIIGQYISKIYYGSEKKAALYCGGKQSGKGMRRHAGEFVLPICLWDKLL